MSRDDSKSTTVRHVPPQQGAPIVARDERDAAAPPQQGAAASAWEVTAPIDLDRLDAAPRVVVEARRDATGGDEALRTVNPATLGKESDPEAHGRTKGNVAQNAASEEIGLLDTGALSVSLDFSVTLESTLSEAEAQEERPPPPPKNSPRGGDLSDTVIAGRYELRGILGEGGFGAVYRAHDRLSGDEVAVKLLHEQDSEETFRFRAEVSLLRLLRLPDLVHLLDDGLHKGRQFLVTELVEGVPFPGVPAPASWQEMEQPTLKLLEALARVHAHGVVHRDLKPANVLVRPDGTPSLLDFGVAFGPGFSKDGDKGMVVGTPAFLAPEQALGARGDVRSDLYALGAMLYESLTGRLPHEASTLRDLLRAKVNDAVKPIRTYAPEAPPLVCAAIESTLRTRPEERPPSIAALLLMLGVKPEVEHLPRLGGDGPVEQACARLRQGKSVGTTGAAGLGHSRLLADVGAALEHDEFEVWRIHGSRQQWGSLPADARRHLSRVTDASDHSVVQLLRDAREQCVVLIADDAARVDPSTRAAIDKSRIPTMWVGSDHDIDRVTLQPLEADDLRPLFHGPDVLLHLREDAARIAFQRTGGAPRKLVKLLDGWVKSGLCFWDEGKLRITRESLERLETGLRVVPDLDDVEGDDVDAQLMSWVTLAGTEASRDLLGNVFGEDASLEVSQRLEALIADGRLLEDSNSRLIARATSPQRLHARETGRREAHGLIGEGATPGSPGRLLHLIQARDVGRVIEEAELVAHQSMTSGKLGGAFSAVREALAFVRAAERFDAEPRLLRWLALLSFDMQAERWVEVAMYEVERGREHSQGLDALAELLHATHLVRYVERDAERVQAVVDSVPVFEDVWLERARRALTMSTGSRLSAGARVERARKQLVWAKSTGDPALTGRIYGWVGLTLYYAGHFHEAAAQHELCAASASESSAQVAPLTNAASAFLEAGELESAALVAAKALALAEVTRSEMLACRASWLVRSIATRRGSPPGFDDGLLEAYRLCGDPDTRAKGFEVEAAIAWRAGAYGRARQLAEVALAGFEVVGRASACALMRCLQGACDARLGAPFIKREALDALSPYPRLLAQGCALQMMSGAGGAEERELLQRALEKDECSPGRGGLIWEILSRDECAAT